MMGEIIRQAPDALLFTASNTLKGDSVWGQYVYSKFADSKIFDLAKMWVVCRILGDVNNDWRGDRESLDLMLAVQAVSPQSALSERGAARIRHLLHLSGVNDRRTDVSIGTHSEWHFLSCAVDRSIRVIPNKDLGMRWYETGYVFQVRMEAKDAYV